MRLEKCWFCSSTIYPGHGIQFVRNDAKLQSANSQGAKSAVREQAELSTKRLLLELVDLSESPLEPGLVKPPGNESFKKQPSGSIVVNKVPRNVGTDGANWTCTKFCIGLLLCSSCTTSTIMMQTVKNLLNFSSNSQREMHASGLEGPKQGGEGRSSICCIFIL